MFALPIAAHIAASRPAAQIAAAARITKVAASAPAGEIAALPIAAQIGVAATAACAGADPAVTSLTAHRFKMRGGVDHYVITTTLTNQGLRSQTPDITQRIELLRDGVVLAPQSVPALGAGVAYKLAFAVDRPAAERSQPLTVTVRYVLASGDAAQNACDRSNDEITKSF